MNLANRVATGKRDDGRDERKYKRTDCGDHLQHDDDSNDDRRYDENCSHVVDYRSPTRPGAINLLTALALPPPAWLRSLSGKEHRVAWQRNTLTSKEQR